MAEETGNVSIDFANRIIENMEELVDKKSAEASAWAEETIAAAREEPREVRSLEVDPGSLPMKPGLPAMPMVRVAPTVGEMGQSPLLHRPPELPAEPVVPAVPDLGDLDTGDMVNEAKTIRIELIAELKAALVEFADRWFPPGQYLEKATAWLERAIDGGATVAVDVEAKIWERDRARLTAEATRATDEAMTMWAGRGFALPPGALAHQVLNIRQGLNNAMSQQSRDIAIKAHQDEIDNAKFAVQQAIGLRTAAMAAAVNFIQALASSMAQAIQLTSSQADALARIASAKAAVFSAEVDARTKVFGAVAGANTDLYRAETGARTDIFRAEIDGYRAKTSAEVDVYRAVTGVELDQFRAAASALVDFYRAETSAAELPLRARTATAQMDLEAKRANQASDLAQIQELVKAFASNSAQVASQTAAAIQGQRMNASVANNSTTSMSLPRA